MTFESLRISHLWLQQEIICKKQFKGITWYNYHTWGCGCGLMELINNFNNKLTNNCNISHLRMWLRLRLYEVEVWVGWIKHSYQMISLGADNEEKTWHQSFLWIFYAYHTCGWGCGNGFRKLRRKTEMEPFDTRIDILLEAKK